MLVRPKANNAGEIWFVTDNNISSVFLLSSFQSYLANGSHFVYYPNKIDICLRLCFCDCLKIAEMHIVKRFSAIHFATRNLLVFCHLLYFCELVKDKAIFILSLSVFGATCFDNSLAYLVNISNCKCIHKDIHHFSEQCSLHVSSFTVNKLQILKLALALRIMPSSDVWLFCDSHLYLPIAFYQRK